MLLPTELALTFLGAKLNQPTPLTDAFLSAVPDGTPLPGFTKVRSNLVTNYRFDRGPLKGCSIGGGGQYREHSYQGNFDLNRDGVPNNSGRPATSCGMSCSVIGPN